MIAVIFEVRPEVDHKQAYLDLAASLRPLLDDIDGFISIERFESLSEPGRFCRSPSGAMKQLLRNGGDWKHTAAHRSKGEEVFSRTIVCG